MKTTRNLLLLLAISLLFAACGPKNGGNSSNGAGGGSTPESALLDPKGSIAYQFDLLKAGDVDKLRNCFTERLRDRITKELVDKAKGQAGQYTLDDLYASAEPGEYEGKKTMKVKMKNGRTLTTLVQTDGKWLADTIWFN
ncbi:MAG TPA: hypothetical protein VGC87_12805 [Pyrinomonadaceae bacterium]|jgi:hypothetical protein